MRLNEFVYLVIIDEMNKELYPIGTRRSRALEYVRRHRILQFPIAAVYVGDRKKVLEEASQFIKQFDETNWENIKPMDTEEVLKLIR